ncbi:hypothetical protein [Sulfitobacter sp. M22]|uniref:hypothetical protein n=1 Tax=Sulfitobacter sp. M22 TaxID=2675332 RepID=UPI001F2D30FF|nr:hypothetical protein [Sulfitobacter sp. M22]MCF7725750.1 hypothetical protein [Sulfitobacter sp. M22]
MNDRDYPPIDWGTVSEVQLWRWKSLRSFGFSFGIWPIEWALGLERSDDQFGGQIVAQIGPVELTFSYNDGSMLRSKSS